LTGRAIVTIAITIGHVTVMIAIGMVRVTARAENEKVLTTEDVRPSRFRGMMDQ
jgi:hypothetical protein